MGITAINGIAITASLSNTASRVIIVDNSSGAGNFFPLFVTNSGSAIPGVDQQYTYNPIANTLTVANFVGTASFATAASASRLGSTSTNATHYIPFTPQFFGGGLGAGNLYQEANLLYNPSTFEFRGGLINQQNVGTKASTADANLTIDASLTQSMTWIASFTATRSLIINNLTSGREVEVYIRNTNATQRQIIFSGSSTTTGHVLINMATPFLNGASTTTQNIPATNGTIYPRIKNIANTIVGSI